MLWLWSTALLHKGGLQRYVCPLVRPVADLAPAAARARLVRPTQVLGAAAAGGGMAARREAHLAWARVRVGVGAGLGFRFRVSKDSI